MPDYLLRAQPGLITDAQYFDFDEQAERLIGFDQTYIQLSPGPFQGRFLSAEFGQDMAVHIEHCNRALEQSVAAPKSVITLGVVVSQVRPFLVNGSELTRDDVFICASGQDLFFRSPEHGAILAIVIAKDKLSAQTGLSERALEWLQADAFQTRILRAPQLARRVREDTVQALQSACFEGQSKARVAAIGEALLTGVASKLSLEIAGLPKPQEAARNPAFDRFYNCRRILHDRWQDIHSMNDLLTRTRGGRRALQLAFATHVDLGPLTYHRILRLHLAKQALQDPDQFSASIGDIAARFEFWNWSLFTSQYKTHFGELPSQTRAAAGFEAEFSYRWS